MKKFLTAFSVLLVIGLVVVLVTALFLSKDMKLERAIEINRPVAEVFDYVKSVENMNAVGVWQSQDPNIKVTTSGTDGEVGYVSRWESKVKNVGVGEQEITNIVPNDRIDSELRFEKPFKSVDQAYIRVNPLDNERTEVFWGFESKMPWPSNLMIPSVSKQLSQDLEEGLKNLKSKLES